MDTPWAHSTKQVLEHFGVDPSTGLNSKQQTESLEIYGKNGQWPGDSDQ